MTNFEHILYEWYHLNGRNLPWRNTSNPYHIWISEVILQQTQVAQGLGYYHRFLERFPNVVALSAASEQDVLMVWQGLGYYSRARHAHSAAKIITSLYNGIFPSKYDQIKTLPGIGDYTAAAIASFAFHLPYAVVDGNVFRFFARFFCIDTPIDTAAGKKLFFGKANELLDRNRPHLFNQAVMEFGALVCIPLNPDCNSCPLNHLCQAFSIGRVSDFPVKSKKMERKKRFLNFIVIDLPDKQTVIQRRGVRDIWHGLYQFPLYESYSLVNAPAVATYLRHNYPCSDFSGGKVHECKHLLTHQELLVTFWRFSVSDIILLPGQVVVATADLPKFPFPQLLVTFIDSNKDN